MNNEENKVTPAAEAVEKADTAKPVKSGKPVKKINTKTLKYGTVATVLTVVVIAVVVLVNVIVNMVGERVNLKLDMTSQNIFALSDETKDYLKTLDQDVEIVTMSDEAAFANTTDQYYKQAYEVLKQYGYASDKISVKFVDMTADPTYANKFSAIYKGTISADSIVVSCGNKIKVTNLNSLFNAELDYQTYSYNITSSKAEQVLTSAVMYVTDPNPKKAVILDIDSAGIGNTMLRSLLENDGFDVTVSAVADAFTDNPDLVVVNAPLNDFDEDTIQLLYNFLENGGSYGKNMIYLASPTQKDTANIDAFLAEWGLQVAKGVVGDMDSNNLASSSTYYAFKTYITANDYSGNVSNDTLPVISYNSRPVNVLFETSGNVTAAALLTTADTAFILTDEMQAQAEQGVEPEITQSAANIMAISNKYAFDSDNNRQDSNILVIGASQMLNESITGTSYYNNGDYFVSIVNKMVGKDSGITIVAKDLSAATFDTSVAAAGTSFWVFIILIPLAVLATGIVVWLRRRHK